MNNLISLELKQKLISNNLYGDEKSVNQPICPIIGDASDRRYFRIHNDKQSYILCTYVNTDELVKFVNVTKFYQKHKINVPTVLYSDLEEKVLILDDLGNNTLLRTLATIDSKGEEKKYYKKSLDLVCQLHCVSLDGKRSGNIFNNEFDENKYLFELNWTQKYFVDKLLKSNSIDKEQIKKSFCHFLDNLDKENQVLVHRDFHSKNIMCQSNKIYMIDHQDTMWGSFFYDLVSLIEDSYYQLDEKTKLELKTYTWNSYVANGLYSGDYLSFERKFEYFTIQRLYKAIGSFSYLYLEKNKFHYLKYISSAMERIRNILLKYKEFDLLRKTLFKVYYAN